MGKIGSGGPKIPAKPSVQQASNASAQKTPKQVKVTQQQVQNVFESKGQTILTKLQQQNPAQLASLLNFSNTDWAMLARTFYEVLRQNMTENRKKRAKLFAKAILKANWRGKRGRINELLDDEAEENQNEQSQEALEQFYEMIAEQLDTQPVFAQLVDEVTESVRRIK